jgi:hypothetical protein
MCVVARLARHHEVVAKCGTPLQLNDVAAGSLRESLLNTLSRTHCPSFSSRGSVLQGAFYVLPWQLGRSVELADTGRGEDLIRSRRKWGRNVKRQEKNKPQTDNPAFGIPHAIEPF